MEILYALLILLATTRAFGELAERYGQPALVGELLAGIVLGVIVTHFGDGFAPLVDLEHDAAFVALTDLGIFFLMLLAGLELRPRQLAESSGGALPVALGGLLLPLVLGFALGWWLLPDSPVRAAQSLFLGVALSITAVPVSVKILMDLDRMDSRIGRTIVSAALFDDVLSLLLLAVLTAVIRQGALPEPLGLLRLAAEVALFFAVAAAAGRWVFPRLGNAVHRLRGAELDFTFLLLAGFAYSVLAELLSMHFIIGAFFAGLFFERRTIDAKTFESVLTNVRAVTTGFLAPIFFASIGMHLDPGSILAAPVLLLLLLVAASLGKIAGSGLPARALGHSSSESLAVGVGMNGRGAVELIVADVALSAGLFSQPDPTPDTVRALYPAVVVMAIATTLATPIALGHLLRRIGR